MGDIASAYRRQAKRGPSVSVRYYCRLCKRGGTRNAMVWHLRVLHNMNSIAANRECSEALADLRSREADVKAREKGLL